MPTSRIHPSIRLRNSVIFSLLISLVSVGVAKAQDSPLNGAFAAGIDYAQQRMVKVYGATAGRVDGYASGVLVSDDGLIITMQGVYLDGRNLKVTLADGSQHPATVLRRERSLQLALLKIDLETPEYFKLTEEDVGKKGDWVVTLSNAFKVADGVEPMSVNLGIISLRSSIEARLSPRDVAYKGPIVLIDAITSNPGAGGGAVVTIDGELVGTIGRVINSSETNTRLNYAVPSKTLLQFVEDRLPKQEADVVVAGEPGDLGIRLFTLGGRASPAYVDRVISGSPASEAGLRPDDLVISLSGAKIGTVREYDEAMKDIREGQEVIIVIKRGQQLIRVPLTAVKK